MSYTGMVPSERSSGARSQRGSITKCGNGHLRRVLIEAAWHNRHRPCLSNFRTAKQAGDTGGLVSSNFWLDFGLLHRTHAVRPGSALRDHMRSQPRGTA
jgi:transposase